ncbi:MAG TPA: hypothetical protein VF543_22085 [Pyrinomonadaceae bacterium]|jgi:integrase
MSNSATNIITYSSLNSRYEKYLRESGKESQIQNLKTIIKTWLVSSGLTETSSIGSELNSNFEDSIKHYEFSQEQSGIKQSTYRSRVSHIRAFKKFYDSVEGNQNLSGEFHVVLSELIVKAGFKSYREFHSQCVSDICRLPLLRFWCTGQYRPEAASIPLIEELERRLHVKAGTLTSLLSKRLRGLGKGKKRGQTPYRRKIMALQKKRYRYWSDTLETEWMGVVRFKTASYLPEGQKRVSAWTSSEGSEGVSYPSAEIGKAHLKCFFGFCCLSKSDDPLLNGPGMSTKEMTLALLADKRLVEDYLEFQKIRAGGIYTEGTLGFIEIVRQLLKAETGYLYQHPELARKLKGRVSVKKWLKRCSDTRDRLTNINSQLKQKGLIVKGRDPEESIEQILARDRPLHILLQMIKDMQSDMPPAKSSKNLQALHYRNILLIGLLSSNPLRIRQFVIMQFERHLKRRENGEWWVEFKKGEFKNRNVLRSDYSVRVARHLWPIIDCYRSEFRPYLAGAKKCNYVFRQESRRRGDKDNIRPMSRIGLTQIIEKLTGTYIDITPGFFPHAFRHIVATDIIKKNPEFGFFLASKALHDKLETVERAYAHLKTHEYFEPVNRHFGDAWEEVIGRG